MPVAFDTDVNAAALGEWRWGAAQGLDTFIYLTIGTGIGGGGLANGRLMHGHVHPEMGYVRIPHDTVADPFAGVARFTATVSKVSPAARPSTRGGCRRPSSFRTIIRRGRLEARYLALALVNFICTLSPERIVIGGGVMSKPFCSARPAAGDRAAQQLRSNPPHRRSSTTMSFRPGWPTMPASSAR